MLLLEGTLRIVGHDSSITASNSDKVAASTAYLW